MEYTIQNSFLTVKAQSFGAELISILAADGTEYLWQGDPHYWEGRSPVLFPYVARLYGGEYSIDGKTYRMAIHGLAPYTTFTVAEHGPASMTFAMEDTALTREQYPRRFCFSVTYSLRENTLAIRYAVENRDELPLYFGLGGHPGFRIPLVPGKTFTDYRLRFGEPSVPQRVGFTPDCFLNGADMPFPLKDGILLPLDHSLFDEDAIVLRDMPREVTLETEGDKHTVKARYPQMPYLGLWHMPKTDAGYVCIEPWCSLPSFYGEKTVWEEKKDLLRVEPGCRYENEWTLTFGF